VALGLPPWAAALCVGTALVVVGGGTAYYLFSRMRSVDMTFNVTRENVRETLEWAKLQARR
jgi:hypothetical protein